MKGKFVIGYVEMINSSGITERVMGVLGILWDDMVYVVRHPYYLNSIINNKKIFSKQQLLKDLRFVGKCKLSENFKETHIPWESEFYPYVDLDFINKIPGAQIIYTEDKSTFDAMEDILPFTCYRKK